MWWTIVGVSLMFLGFLVIGVAFGAAMLGKRADVEWGEAVQENLERERHERT